MTDDTTQNINYLEPGGKIGDFAQYINELVEYIENTTGRVDDVEKGNYKLAYVDYSVVSNTDDMTAGTYYLVPYDSTGTFIQFDEDTGIVPSEVHHFNVFVKASDGTVYQAFTWYPEGNLENVAFIDRDNVFKAKIAKASLNDFDLLDDYDLVAKGEIADYLNNSYEYAHATTTSAGIVELATNAETYVGADTERAVTPSSLNYTLTQKGYASYTVRYSEPATFTDNNICIIIQS